MPSILIIMALKRFLVWQQIVEVNSNQKERHIAVEANQADIQ